MIDQSNFKTFFIQKRLMPGDFFTAHVLHAMLKMYFLI